MLDVQPIEGRRDPRGAASRDVDLLRAPGVDPPPDLLDRARGDERELQALPRSAPQIDQQSELPEAGSGIDSYASRLVSVAQL